VALKNNLRNTFKEPTNIGLISASVLSIFQFLNSFGLMDNLANRSWSTNSEKEKFLLIPNGTEFWGFLQPGLVDYVIVAFLLYTLIGLWAHRPVDPGLYKRKKKKKRLISIKSGKWLRRSVLLIVISTAYTQNKRGLFADWVNNVMKTDYEGRANLITREFEPVQWVITDFIELILLYSLVSLALWKAIKFDPSRLVISDSSTQIEQIWINSDKSERLQNSNVDEGASRINDAFTDLVSMLSAAASLNVASLYLEDGNVRGAMNKWRNLTHKKGRQSKEWRGLTESLDDVGKFKKREEEE